MSNRRDVLIGLGSLLACSTCLRPVLYAASAQDLPTMPPRNPWLAESVYPTSHFNPGATDSVLFAGPVHGRKLYEANI